MDGIKAGADTLHSNKAIRRLAFPAILSGIAEPLISLADTAFLGQVGRIELAAVGIAGGFYLMMVWILAQALTAISAIVSRHYGQDTLGEIRGLIPQAFFANVLLGGLFCALSLSFPDFIFSLYKAEGELLEACVEYYNIRALGFPFTLTALFLFGVFRGLQNTRWAMGIALTAAAINVMLDALLIFGIEGIIPAMGLKGAAWASLSAQVFMSLAGVFILLRRTSFHLRISLPIHPHFRWLSRMSGDLLLRTLLLNLCFYLATRYATSYGEEVIAAHTIALNIWLFSSFFIDGYAHAGDAIAGRLYGMHAMEALRSLGVRIERISIGLGIVLAFLYGMLYPFMGTFFSNDHEVVHQFNSVFFLVIITQPFNAVAFAYDGIYKGLGLTKVLRNLLILASLMGFVPVALLFHHFMPGLMGIWLAFFAWMLIRSSYLFIDFRKRFKLSVV